jgi:hypothetical protein
MSHKDTVDRLRLELSQAKAETENLKRTMVRAEASNAVLQPEPGTP